MAAAEINSQNSEINTGPSLAPSVGHSRMPLPNKGVYKEAGQQANSVLAQVETT